MTGTVERVEVGLGDRSYDILVGSCLIEKAGGHVAPLLRRKRTFVISDETVAALYGESLTGSLAAAGIRTDVLSVPPGEGSKSFARLEDLLRRLLQAGAERGDMLIALGGGVVGDLAGFAASVLLRGVDFIQIPTTLLAQVDSSVGGKTGINLPEGKNLVGAFHQPRLVLADMASLETLPARELRAGYAETVKYGLIDDPAFFDWLEANGPALLKGDADARRQAVVTSVEAKARVVAEDEREAGRRALLNLGHTFAHALEAETAYGAELLHGEAVALGMCLAFDFSARLGLCPPDDAERVRRHLSAAGLPVDIPAGLRGEGLIDRLLGHMAKDKKVSDGKLTFILARGIGQAFVAGNIDPAAVRGVLDAALAA